MNYTITRYESSKVWDCAIRPDSGAFIIFIDREEHPYVYKRVGDVTDEAGDTRERYAYAPVENPDRHVPENLDDPEIKRDPERRTIVVAPTDDPGSIHAFTATCGSCAGGGATRLGAVNALLTEHASALG